ncbi:Nitrogen permease regulator 2, partial [Blyttiomyces sp. JEL0837]
YAHAERFNNFKTDELYIERANLAEASFLEKVHDDEHTSMLARQAEDAASQLSMEEDLKTFNNIVSEMRTLTLQCAQNKAAAERMKRAKNILKERRAAMRQHLARVEARQERERKSLAEAHARHLKLLNYGRNLHIRDVEDPEIRIILKGFEFNNKTLNDEIMKTKQEKAEAAKLYHAQVLDLIVRNQKEIEQLREEHLLQLKHITRYCDREIEIIDENESLLAEHTAKEQRYEAELKAKVDFEEARILSQIAAARVHAEQRAVQDLANQIREAHRKEARQLITMQRREARKREVEFWKREEEELKSHLLQQGFETSGQLYDRKKKELLSGFPDSLTSLYDPDYVASDEDEEPIESSHNDLNMIEIENQKIREMAVVDMMRKQNKSLLRKMKLANKKIRESRRAEQQKSLLAILEAQTTDIKKLKEQQAKEAAALVETQRTSLKLDEDNKASNDRLYAMLPRFVADKMKSGVPIEPTPFNNLTILIADIVSFTSLSSKSSANQIVTLLNRLYSAMDQELDSYEDVYKLETIGDAYCIVAGLNNQERSVKANAIDIIECAMSFINIVQNLDMSDQVQDKLQIRIGIHTGPAVGGVANPTMPKFSLFGDTVTTTSLLEQSSQPMQIHISGATQALVKDEYDLDVSESINLEGQNGAKQRLSTFWVLGRKSANGGKFGQSRSVRMAQ